MIFATGKVSKSLCDRCGLTFDYRYVKSERSTGFRVCPPCNDGKYNLFTHPQNGPFLPEDDAINVRHPRLDVAFVTVGTSVSVWLSLVAWEE